MTLATLTAEPLRGRRGLVVGIANDCSMASGCARAFRAVGADLAFTYLNEKTRPHVEPLTSEVAASILMPLDIDGEGQVEAVFERMRAEWGRTCT
jgi:enoyl-[acyl-carrier protein] reductase I